MVLIEDLAQDWRSQLALDCPEQSAANNESIIRWLLGKDLEQFESLKPVQMKIAQQAMAYRYRILRHRYLGLGTEQAYRRLTMRLFSLVLLYPRIRVWVARSRERQRTIVDVLQEVLQELLHERYMQQQMAWIAECTVDEKLRKALLFASIEEYCLQPIRHQPLLVYRFVNYLHRNQRVGLTQVPINDLSWLLSEESQYQVTQAMEKQKLARMAVKQEFERYLQEKLGTLAVQWLQLYLQGQSMKAIARSLNLEIKQIYRLREKISYHAVLVLAPKSQTEFEMAL